jgi:hypothetical protein
MRTAKSLQVNQPWQELPEACRPAILLQVLRNDLKQAFVDAQAD